MAYDLKEEFRKIYDRTNRREAFLKYTKWSRKVKQISGADIDRLKLGLF